MWLLRDGDVDGDDGAVGDAEDDEKRDDGGDDGEALPLVSVPMLD